MLYTVYIYIYIHIQSYTYIYIHCILYLYIYIHIDYVCTRDTGTTEQVYAATPYLCVCSGGSQHFLTPLDMLKPSTVLEASS